MLDQIWVLALRVGEECLAPDLGTMSPHHELGVRKILFFKYIDCWILVTFFALLPVLVQTARSIYRVKPSKLRSNFTEMDHMCLAIDPFDSLDSLDSLDASRVGSSGYGFAPAGSRRLQTAGQISWGKEAARHRRKFRSGVTRLQVTVMGDVHPFTLLS